MVMLKLKLIQPIHLHFILTKKKTLEYIISKLNWRSLAILWMDDGHLAKAENAGTLCAKKQLFKIL